MNIPWVEKYRPTEFQTIVLDEHNKLFFNNVMEKGVIPNMLFYGPPGTGKTTTIINLIKSYQEKNEETKSGLMIHLNASDERGIDTIRSQLFSFVQSKPFFKKGTKFVILDEVDSMTCSAQQALGYMLHSYVDVRFCLICNYISKIDTTLQTMFIKIKFNKLPKEDIISFLEKIVASEQLSYTRDQLYYIKDIYESDIRSMINYLQMNQHNPSLPIIHNNVWESLYSRIKTENINTIVASFYSISKECGIDIKHMIKDFVFYVCTRYTTDPISKLDLAFHNPSANIDHIIRYVILTLN